MNQVSRATFSNKHSKKSHSKVTTAKSSRKYSTTDEGFEQLIKSKHFQTQFPIQPAKYLKMMRKNMFLFKEYNHFVSNLIKTKNKQNQDFFIDTELWKFTELVIKKFQLTFETSCLGICFYTKYILLQKNKKSNQLYLKKFQMSVCIYLAAKTIELERSIPKYSAYQYFCGQNYTCQDYNEFQRQLTNILQFQLQKTTLVTFLNFYLSIGIFYQYEIIETGRQIEQLETQILQRAMLSLKKGQFLQYQDGNPQIEAIKIIKEIRKKNYMTEQNKNLQLLWDRQGCSLNESKYSVSHLKPIRSLGNLMLNVSRTASTYTHRFIQKESQAKHNPNQITGLIVRTTDKNRENNKKVVLGNQILKRKQNLGKSYKRKQISDDRLDQIHKIKYVAIKESHLNEKSYANRNSKENIKTELVSNQGTNIVQMNMESGLLKTCKSAGFLQGLQFSQIYNTNKLSRFAAPIIIDRVIERSTSRSRKSSKPKLQNGESKKHFQRKNYSNNFSNQLKSHIK